MLRERLNSDGLHSPVEEDFTIETHLPSPSCTALYATHSFTHTLLFLNTYLDTSFISRSRSQHIHNIAEELDPTFKARKCESQISTNPPSGKSADFVKKNSLTVTSEVNFVLFSQQMCVWPLVTRTASFTITCQSPTLCRRPNGRTIKRHDTRPKTREKTANSSDGVNNKPRRSSFEC